ncbi:MAG: hypothetical protein QF577_02300 [Phycisphaerae bacterium]|nr:hypothetical protein [Phycisphaerae bacterium]MDP7636359.1 hypothetical protein [Phycisphaerae bacterium]
MPWRVWGPVRWPWCEIADGPVVVVILSVGHAPVHVGVEIGGIEANGPGVIGDGLLAVAPAGVGVSAVVPGAIV